MSFESKLHCFGFFLLLVVKRDVFLDGSDLSVIADAIGVQVRVMITVI